MDSGARSAPSSRRNSGRMEAVVLAQTAAHGSLDDGLSRGRSLREQRHSIVIETGPDASLPIPDLVTRRKSSSAIAVQQNQFMP